MPALTRKRVNDLPVTWHVHFAGVRVGVISERSGAPPSSDQWEWHCGFYSGSNPGEQRYGTAADFDAARTAFEIAWREYCLSAAKRTSRNGARTRRGTPQNMRGGTARASAGSSMPWSRPFDDPIQLPGRRLLVTLRDAGSYIAALPKAKQESPEWQAAAEALMMAAEDRGPLMHAHIGMLRALNRHVERVFNPNRKDPHWGRRKLARDR
jgi:hypothetical protein